MWPLEVGFRSESIKAIRLFVASHALVVPHGHSLQLVLASLRVEEEVALLATSLGVVKFVFVLASPGQLGSASSVVASAAESLCVVLSVDVFSLSDNLGSSVAIIGFLNLDVTRW